MKYVVVVDEVVMLIAVNQSHSVLKDPARADREFVSVTNNSQSALISLYGGQIFSYIPHIGGKNVFFENPKASYAPGAPVRGGDFLAAPWFGKPVREEDLPLHGLVRTREWTLGNVKRGPEGVTIPLLLSVNRESSFDFGAFNMKQEITVGPKLIVKATFTNQSDKPQNPQLVAHSYYDVEDVTVVKIMGLHGRLYIERAKSPSEPGKEDRAEVTIDQHINRIYHGPAPEVIIDDPVARRIIRITHSFEGAGMQAENSGIVVWNPFGSTSFPDLANTAHNRFICVEPGNQLHKPTVEPGAELVFTKTLEVSSIYPM